MDDTMGHENDNASVRELYNGKSLPSYASLVPENHLLSIYLYLKAEPSW